VPDRIEELGQCVQGVIRGVRVMATDLTLKAKGARTFQAKITIEPEACDQTAETLISLSASLDLLFEELKLEHQRRADAQRVSTMALRVSDCVCALTLPGIIAWWFLNSKERKAARAKLRAVGA